MISPKRSRWKFWRTYVQPHEAEVNKHAESSLIRHRISNLSQRYRIYALSIDRAAVLCSVAKDFEDFDKEAGYSAEERTQG